jgi:hypothetical protein
MHCPLCQTPLPDGAQECNRCDWVRRAPERHDVRDVAALALSLVPGLGHLYKGHVLVGGIVFFVLGPAVLVFTLATVTATVGASLLLPLAFMGAVMVHAYFAQDRRAVVIQRARALESHQPVH